MKSIQKNMDCKNVLWDKDNNPIVIAGYRYNESFYRSSKIFADIIESKSSIEQYIKELNNLNYAFNELRSLCLKELD